jgi:hypothetical protein
MTNNHFAGIKLGPNCPSTHSLLFADDLLVCGQATQQEASRIKQILQEFCSQSGQTPNWGKSGIIFSKNVPVSTKIAIKQIFTVPDIDNNFSHLGHPLIIPGKTEQLPTTLCLTNSNQNSQHIKLINSHMLLDLSSLNLFSLLILFITCQISCSQKNS